MNETFGDLGFWAVILTTAGIYAVLSTGLQLHVGYGGLLNFGQVGFMTVGAYGMGIATVNYGKPLWFGILVGVAGAVVVALLVGIPTLRLRADYLAITTIAGSEILRILALNQNDLTGGPSGIYAGEAFTAEVHRPLIGSLRDSGYDIDRILPVLVLAWTIALLTVLVIRYLVRTPWGRTLRAVREDEDAARALGKNAFLYKLQTLVIGGVAGALAGQLLTFNLLFVSPKVFEPMATFIAFVIIIVAGLGSLWGVLVAAIAVQLLLDGTRYLDLPMTSEQEAAFRFIVVGVVLIVLVALRPQGLFGRREEMVLQK